MLDYVVIRIIRVMRHEDVSSEETPIYQGESDILACTYQHIALPFHMHGAIRFNVDDCGRSTRS
eukprot:3511744-Prorocentrum_lima.AAC.1